MRGGPVGERQLEERVPPLHDLQGVVLSGQRRLDVAAVARDRRHGQERVERAHRLARPHQEALDRLDVPHQGADERGLLVLDLEPQVPHLLVQDARRLALVVVDRAAQRLVVERQPVVREHLLQVGLQLRRGLHQVPQLRQVLQAEDARHVLPREALRDARQLRRDDVGEVVRQPEVGLPQLVERGAEAHVDVEVEPVPAAAVDRREVEDGGDELVQVQQPLVVHRVDAREEAELRGAATRAGHGGVRADVGADKAGQRVPQVAEELHGLDDDPHLLHRGPDRAVALDGLHLLDRRAQVLDAAEQPPDPLLLVGRQAEEEPDRGVAVGDDLRPARRGKEPLAQRGLPLRRRAALGEQVEKGVALLRLLAEPHHRRVRVVLEDLQRRDRVRR